MIAISYETVFEGRNLVMAGFAIFAGFLMILSGTFQIIQGLAAVFNDELFVVGPSYIYQFDLTTWGWVHVIVGAIIALAGLAIFSGRAWGRIIGIIIALLSAIANFFYIPYYPIWSIIIITLDVIIIWALAGYTPEEAA